MQTIMQTFHFKQQQKISVWEETNFSIQAPSQEAAIAFLKSLKSQNLPITAAYDTDEEERIVIQGSEMILETISDITETENNGSPTLLFYTNNYKEI